MRRKTSLAAALVLVIGLLPLPSSADSVYEMIFPVIPDPGYTDTFGDPRSGGRTHAGTDIITSKMTPVVAVADGYVGWMHDEQGGDCCAMELQHDDGYESWYIHLNNDTPGTDDGQGWGFAEGITQGARVTAGQLIGWVGDSGNAEGTVPHLHFELHDPDGTVLNPYPHLNAAIRINAPLDEGYVEPFWDDEGSTHEANIIRLAELGITTGCEPGRFCPNDTVTRAQMATFINRTIELPPALLDHFDDDNGSGHEVNINALAESGISSGCDDRLYCPTAEITRAHMAVFLARAFDLPSSSDNPFGDVSGQHAWAIQAIAAAGITTGCGNGNYCPDAAVTRAQMATFLIRAIDWLAENE